MELAEKLLPPVLPLSVLTGSGGPGTSSGMPTHRDQVRAVGLEPLSSSSQSQLLSHHADSPGRLSPELICMLSPFLVTWHNFI